LEDDVKQLFATHEALAECVLNDPEATACEMTEVILDELHSLRTERGRREEMERRLEEHRIDSDLKIRTLRSETDTQLRELLAIAEHARAEAEKANRTKDEFLAMLSHELRSPMNAMLGWIRILKTAGAQDTDLIRRAVETIERNIVVQAQTVNDLLDMSRILSGKLQMDQGRVEFAAVVAGCIQSLRPSAEDKQIALRLDVKGEELDVLGDEPRLQQVVANLLGNAIKFTDAGGFITVTVEREDASASLVIEDTGQGIAPEFLPHLFERFTQADTGSTRTHGGLGLGLSIVKSIVSLHGGRVEATSAGLGKGARVSVVLPLADARQRAAFRKSPSEPAVDDGTLGTLDVLLVEDDADTRDALQIVLQKHGSRVRSVASVRQALEAYDARPPDLVISDVGMPGENGYVLIRAIRDHEEGRSHRTLAIAITGFASREDHETALRAGFDEHVAKPVEADDLLDRMRVLAASRTEIGSRTT
jgi:signal transduction histidine kinase/ActR/RegA family two-component response regulator